MRDAIVITGARGNLGSKLCQHWQSRYPLIELDRKPADGSPPSALCLDLTHPEGLAEIFQGAKVLVHLAADPTAQQTWPGVIGPNVDAMLHVFDAARLAGVPRIIYASSNHVLGGYKELPDPWLLTTDLPPRPGARYEVQGEWRDSTPYAATKLFGERVGQFLAEVHGIEFLAVRFGWVRPGANRACDIPPDREAWFRLMWLSNRDYLHLMDRCLEATLPHPFLIVNGMSANTGMRWDLTMTRQILGYEPVDDVTRR